MLRILALGLLLAALANVGCTCCHKTARPANCCPPGAPVPAAAGYPAPPCPTCPGS
jgi:hypothetical protein